MHYIHNANPITQKKKSNYHIEKLTGGTLYLSFQRVDVILVSLFSMASMPNSLF